MKQSSSSGNQNVQKKPPHKKSYGKKKYPIPPGDSSYCHAKRAEYLEKNLDKAKQLYEQAISEKERVPSAVKDLAGVLHQQGKTQEAVQILESNENIFDDKSKYQNLLNNLKRQVQPTGNAANKSVQISPISSQFFIQNLGNYFTNQERIQSIECINENSVLITFNSHSSARKAMDCFTA